MSEDNDKIAQLQERLDKVIEYQSLFEKEIASIRSEINLLISKQHKQNFIPTQPISDKTAYPDHVSPSGSTPIEPSVEQSLRTQVQEPPTATPPSSYQTRQTPPQFADSKNSLEKFIGENLISKIGIVILIIGVGIGAKFAIDNNWITPLMRIVFGYATGLGLVGFASKLKEKYVDFSAVLLSGGMATMYFITYFAHAYYQLISQIWAFSLMLIFTILTVSAAIIYNRVIIAQIGLVGAYAIPFLLSEKTGQVQTLFTYIAVINIGILAVSAYKYWSSLFYSSFIFTWITFALWYSTKYLPSHDFALALTFVSIFFVIFHATFLIYKLLKHETLKTENVFFILTNSAIFYWFGSSILNGDADWKNSLGFFAMLNALIHFGIAFLICNLRLGDKTVFYLSAILVLTFLSIAFPIQTKGNWLSLFWTAEAAVLFCIGRIKAITLFENYSYPVMALAGFTLMAEWMKIFLDKDTFETAIYPILNKYFAAGIFFVLAFGFVNLVNRDARRKSSLPPELAEIAKYAIAAAFLFVLYNVFRVEIGNYFHWEEMRTAIKEITDGYSFTIKNPALGSYNILWQFSYTMLFLSVLGWLNVKKIKNSVLGYANLVLNVIITASFLLIGLYVLSELRDLYLTGETSEYFQNNIFHLVIRYISIPFLLLLFWTIYNYINQEFINRHIPQEMLKFLFDLGFYFSIWILVSSELLHWLDVFRVEDSYKLGLSILWGIYALLLIILGIYYRKAHLRIGAIVLFALTLVKLFLYDLSDLGTISKTIVFISLGILLLIVSFLYNKFKHLIFEEIKK